jgi:quercetin dioxygenase-like cupin family protein
MKLATIEAVREYAVEGPKGVELGHSKDLRCLAYFFKAGQRLGPVHHAADTLFYIVRGRARMRIGNREEGGRSGEIFIGQAGEEIGIGNDGRDELIVLAVLTRAQENP